MNSPLPLALQWRPRATRALSEPQHPGDLVARPHPTGGELADSNSCLLEDTSARIFSSS